MAEVELGKVFLVPAAKLLSPSRSSLDSAHTTQGAPAMAPRLSIASKQGVRAPNQRAQRQEATPAPPPPSKPNSATTSQADQQASATGSQDSLRQEDRAEEPKRRKVGIAGKQGISLPSPRPRATSETPSLARAPSRAATEQPNDPTSSGSSRKPAASSLTTSFRPKIRLQRPSSASQRPASPSAASDEHQQQHEDEQHHEAGDQPVASTSRTTLNPSFRPRIRIQHPVSAPQTSTELAPMQDEPEQQQEREKDGQDFSEDEFGPTEEQIWGVQGGEEQGFEQWAAEYGGVVSDEVPHLADGENEMADYILAILGNPNIEGEPGINDIVIPPELRNEIGGSDGQKDDEEERRRIEQLGKIPGPTVLHHHAPNPALDIDGSIVVDAPEGTAPSMFFQAVPIDSGVRLSSEFLSKIDQCDVPYAAAPHNFQLQRLLSLSARLASAKSIAGQVVKTTLSNYGFGVKEFIRFCEDNKIPPNERFPCSAAIVMSFLRSVVGTGSESKVKKRADSLRFLYHIHDLALPDFAELRKDLMRQAKMAQPKPREPRRPVLVEDLVGGIRNLEKESIREPLRRSSNIALKAAWLLATWGMLRGGEVCTRVMQQRADGTGFHPDINLHGGCFTYVAETDEFPQHYAILLPWTKVEGREPVTIKVCGQTSLEDGYLDPIAAITEHLRVNNPSPNEPAFAYVGDEGTRRWLSTNWFKERWSAALAGEGRKGFKGHSFRIGGASIYTKAGKDHTWIKGAGRWKSHKSFELYIRSQLEEASKHLADVTEEEYRPARKGKKARPTAVEVEEDDGDEE